MRHRNCFGIAILLAAYVPVTGQLPEQSTSSEDIRNRLAAVQDVEHRLVTAFIDGKALDLPEQAALTIKFHSDGKVSGNSGINQYYGSLDLMPSGSFTWQGPHFATTRLSGDATLALLENSYLESLWKTRLLKFTDTSDLVMISPDGLTTLTFKSVAATTSDLSGLQTAELALVRLTIGGKRTPMPASAKVTIRFEGSRFSGQSIINSYSGAMHIQPDGRITLAPMVESTLMSGSAEWMDIENAYFNALGAVRRLRTTSRGLILESEDASTVIEFASE